MSEDGWLAFWPQCSDALDYLETGRKCAEQGICFDPLRPVVSNLWFSLPFRMGWAPTSLLWLHLLLGLLSVWLCARLVCRLAGISRVMQVMVVLVASVAVHGVFLLPTFFHSLSDTPAALFVLSGMALAGQGVQTRQAWYYLPAGLLLGLAAGLRVFYLYPLLGLLAAWLLLSVASRQWRALALLVALVPVLGQVWVTHRHAGEWSYLPSEGTQYWRNLHQNSAYIGYDTLLPEEGYPWVGAAECQGLWPAARAGNWAGLVCTLRGRLSFLLGSYSQQTYVQTGRIQWDYLEVDPRIKPLDLQGEDWPFDRTQGGGRLALPARQEGSPWWILQEVWIEQPGPLTASLTVKDASPVPQQDSWLAWRLQDTDGRVLQTGWLQPGPRLQRHHWHTRVDQPGRYAVLVGGSTERDWPVAIDAGDFTVSAGEAEQPYPMASDQIRQWSMVWLGVQLLLLVAAVLGWLVRWRAPSLLLVLPLLPALVLAQSLLIIPEQRFVVVTEILLWLWLTGWLLHRSGQKPVT